MSVVSVDYLKRKVEELSNLPTLPGVVKFIGSLIEDSNTSAQDLAAVISRDQVLSAKILRLVNSPIYGFPGRISSVSHALVLLGFNVVKGLLLSTTVFSAFAGGVQGLWEHSLGTALISRRLARGLGQKDMEEVMIAGLLHDLGKVVLAHLLPEECGAARLRAVDEHRHIGDIEKEVFGVNHAQVGAWAARSWHLPDRLVVALEYHHRPSRAKEAMRVPAIVQLSDILARSMGYGDGGDSVVPALDREAYQHLGLTDQELAAALKDVEQEYQRGIDFFKADAALK